MGNEENEHFSDSITNEALTTPEAKATLKKYATQDDANIALHNAQKQIGVAYKLPESMDKLPDDNMRAEFATGALKVLGSVDNVEGLKDFDFNIGRNRAEGYEATDADKAWATAYSEHIVKNKIPVSMAKQQVEFYNTMMAKAEQSIEDTYTANSEATNKKMLELLKSEENVAKHADSIKTLFRNHAGLSAEQYESIADALVESKFVTSDILQFGLGNIAAQLVTEGETVQGGGGGGGTTVKEQTPYEAKKERYPGSPTEWGKPDDKWEDQSLASRKIFRKKPEKPKTT